MAWWQTAKVGEFIVCVNDDPVFITKTGDRMLDGLRKSTVYTVREILICPAWHVPAVKLKEIVRPVKNISFGEVPYGALRFRPVDPKRIEVFRSLLNPVREDA